jgi:hypothetical protein
MAKLIINCNSAFAFLSLTKPRILIDNVKQPKGSWQSPNVYELNPGAYQITVYLPSPLFLIPTCRAKEQIQMNEGDTLTFKYKLPLFTFLPGKLILERHIKGEANHTIRQEIKEQNQIIIPDTCPHCKNPNTKKIRLCEWCGNQIV